MSPQNPGQSRRLLGGGWKTWLSVAAACALTAALFWYLARVTTFSDWVQLYRGLSLDHLAAYMGCFLASMGLKAWRYRLLLNASGESRPPRYRDLVTLTFVSNLFVDLLPSRTGSLAYIVFLNRKLKVGLPACFSSFAFSFIFDIIGMLPLLLLALLLHGAETKAWAPELWALLAVLAAGGVAALYLLEKVLAAAGRAAGWLAGRLPQRAAELAARVARELEAMAGDVERVKSRGVYGRVLAVSVAIRLFKYLGLFLLVQGLAAQWPEPAALLTFPVVLFALLVAEATASLPVSGLAGFGAYEGMMMATLAAAGLPETQMALIPFGLHLLTQTIDYTLGGAALVALSLTAPPEEKHDQKT
jgi:uncharacterized protein (TIRG00374 family)